MLPINLLIELLKLAHDQNSELISHYINQLNTVICYHNLPNGFLYYFNGNAFTSGINDKQEDYWDKLAQGYEIMLQIKPDMDLFELTLEKVKICHHGIDSHEWSMFKDCEFSWECKNCDPMIRKICGKREYKCTHVRASGSVCGKKLYEYPETLTEKFMSEPICESHSESTYPKRSYTKYKYGETSK